MKLKKRILNILIICCMLLMSMSSVVMAEEVPANTSSVSTPMSVAFTQENGFGISFDLNDRQEHVRRVEFEDGSYLEVGARPKASLLQSLNGTWDIWGDNGFVRMEYSIDLEPSGSYTKITDAYGLTIRAILTSYEDEDVYIVRSTETSSRPAVAEGFAKFTYLDNQWVTIWEQSGGTRASVQNDEVNVELF